MDLLFNNQRKRKNKNDNSFNMSNATKTFKKLIEKHKKDQLKTKKVFYNKTDEFFSSLNNVFFKEEIKETDSDYIFREIKNQIRINQHLVDLYGANASRKFFDHSREPIRFDKRLVFNPLKDSDEKQIRYTSFFNDNKNKKNKKLNLPCILKKNINPKENLLKKLLESDNDSKRQNNNLNYNIKIEDSYYDDKNRNYTIANDRYVPIKSYNFFSKTNNDLLNLKNSGNNNSTFTLGNKSNTMTNSSFDKSEYVMTLDNLNDQIRINQRKHRRYFNSNDYGCNLSKYKYNYISKQFFN